MLGVLYFYFVSRVALRPAKGPSLPRVMLHSLMLWSVLTVVFYVVFPIFLIFAKSLSSSPLVMIVLFFLLAWPVTWLCLMTFFSTYAVFTESKNVVSSFSHNIRLLRYGLPPIGWFALIAVVISRGMDLLWSLPPAESWMVLVGILGHAFISTGLLSASFVYYREMSAWLEEALQWINTHQVTSARV